MTLFVTIEKWTLTIVMFYFSDSLTKDVKVCGCCLGSSSSDANEIVDCDGCGISGILTN